MHVSDTLIDRIRVQTHEVCAEVDEIEEKARGASPEARIAHEKRLVELRRRCETLESRLADLEWGEESWGDIKKGLLGALENARRRLTNLQAEPPNGGTKDGGVGPDIVCTDELDEDRATHPDVLEGTVLSAGGAMAGLTPLESPPGPRREDRKAGGPADDSPECGECR
jgi:hypothetical protein